MDTAPLRDQSSTGSGSAVSTVGTSNPLVGREYAVIRHCYNILVETISKDVLFFSIKLCEKKLISNEVNSEMASMCHVGEKEKADILIKKVLNCLSSSESKEEWFHTFAAIFSVNEVAERLEEFYSALKMIDDAADAIGRRRFQSGSVADVDDMNMLYKTLTITRSQPSEELLICHCSLQADLTIRFYPLVSRGADWFGRGFMIVWSLGFGGGLAGPFGAAILASAMDRFVGQYLVRGFEVNRDGMIVIPAREILQSIPNKDIKEGTQKKLYTFIHTLPDANN